MFTVGAKEVGISLVGTLGIFYVTNLFICRSYLEAGYNDIMLLAFFRVTDGYGPCNKICIHVNSVLDSFET
jgi:hypothetical protein